MIKLENYLIPAEEGLFSKIKEKREQNIAKINADKSAKIDLWIKEKYKIKKIIEDITKAKLKEYTDLELKYTFDPKQFSFGDDNCLAISDPKCDTVIIEYNQSKEYDDRWNGFFYAVLRTAKAEISKKIESKVIIKSFDDAIIQVKLYDWRLIS